MDLQRVEMLLGQEKVALLQKATVAIVGLGGVGSYIAEALCRCGIGSLLLIDADVADFACPAKSNGTRCCGAVVWRPVARS